MNIKPPEVFPETLAQKAVRLLAAYHRAANLNGTLYQLSTAAALPPGPRERVLAEIVLRAMAEGYVAHALAPVPGANPAAVYLHMLSEIRSMFGEQSHVDVIFRVNALTSDLPDGAAFLSGLSE